MYMKYTFSTFGQSAFKMKPYFFGNTMLSIVFSVLSKHAVLI